MSKKPSGAIRRKLIRRRARYVPLNKRAIAAGAKPRTIKILDTYYYDAGQGIRKVDLLCES